MSEIANYEEQVYAGVLGKVIGVYMGRPFEGWRKDDLVAYYGVMSNNSSAMPERDGGQFDDGIREHEGASSGLESGQA